MVEGFRFSLNAKANNQFLPMNSRMFFRHSMVECYPSSSLQCGARGASADSGMLTSSQEDRMILSLLLKQNEVKDKLVQIMQRIHKVRGGAHPVLPPCIIICADKQFWMIGRRVSTARMLTLIVCL